MEDLQRCFACQCEQHPMDMLQTIEGFLLCTDCVEAEELPDYEQTNDAMDALSESMNPAEISQ